MADARIPDNQLIAVVEDDEASRDSFEVLLQNAGYLVETFALGRPFLAAFDTLEPHCVLLEARLPDMDGLRVLEKLRVAMPPPPVILMSRVPKVPDHSTVQRLGAMLVLEKPIEHACLFSAIRMATESVGETDTALI